MEQIKGKVLIFTDLHLGLKNGSKSRLAICINVIKEIINYIKTNNIDTCLFLGDWHHVRSSTENNVMNVSYKLMSALAKSCKVYCILGNHDIYMKNTVDINSMVIFNNIPNVTIVSNIEDVFINDKRTLMVPWLGNVSAYKKETYDIIFGHFDISSKYLIKSYIEDNSLKTKISEKNLNDINSDKMLETNTTSTSNAGDFVGDFVDVVKRNGVIFSGHIHNRKEFLSKGRNFIFVGSPYQQNLGEKNNICGFYTLDEKCNYTFHEITNVPKHVEIKMSEVIEKIDTFDFSIIKNNILHKIYDIEVDNILDAKISQKINDWHPYEELLPDYDVDISTNSEIKLQNESIELIKKSKLEYIKSYIDNIDENVLKDKNIDKDRLYKILTEYYNIVTEEK